MESGKGERGGGEGDGVGGEWRGGRRRRRGVEGREKEEAGCI